MSINIKNVRRKIMTEFVIGPGGTVIPSNKAKDWLNQDGKEHTPETEAREQMDRQIEKVMLLNKRSIHNSALTPDKQEQRNQYFKNLIEQEILQLKEVDKERKEMGLPPLSDKDKAISVKDGVVISKYRQDMQASAQKEQIRAEISTYNNAAGVHSCHEM